MHESFTMFSVGVRASFPCRVNQREHIGGVFIIDIHQTRSIYLCRIYDESLVVTAGVNLVMTGPMEVYLSQCGIVTGVSYTPTGVYISVDLC